MTYIYATHRFQFLESVKQGEYIIFVSFELRNFIHRRAVEHEACSSVVLFNRMQMGYHEIIAQFAASSSVLGRELDTFYVI